MRKRKLMDRPPLPSSAHFPPCLCGVNRLPIIGGGGGGWSRLVVGSERRSPTLSATLSFPFVVGAGDFSTLRKRFPAVLPLTADGL